MLEVENMIVSYQRGRALDQPPVVDGVTFSVGRGEIVGLVGESGCGKTTIARAVVGAVPAHSGRIALAGQPLPARRPAAVRRRVQMIFQDPASSLDPRLTVARTIELAAARHRAGGTPDPAVLLERVGLPAEVAGEKPRRLSGGQRQRVAIARALATEPEVLVADEVVASLDVSAAGAVLNLLRSISRDLGVAVLFISHDLSVVRSLCDRTLVMYLGQIVEQGETAALFSRPGHPYTRALLDSVPSVRGRQHGLSLVGDDASRDDVTTRGCRFRPRCPFATDRCAEDEPRLVGDDHLARCHYAWETGAVTG